MIPVLLAAASFSDVSAVITLLGLVCGFGLVYIVPLLITRGTANIGHTENHKGDEANVPAKN